MNLVLLITLLMAPTPNRDLAKDEDMRDDLSIHIGTTAVLHGLDPVLLTFWAYGESSLDQSKIGARKEVGVMQAKGIARALCEARDLDVAGDYRDSLECGAWLIHAGMLHCGRGRDDEGRPRTALERGLAWYASGKCRGTPMAWRAVDKRRKQAELWNKRKQLFW